jgi:hypothetical protein
MIARGEMGKTDVHLHERALASRRLRLPGQVARDRVCCADAVSNRVRRERSLSGQPSSHSHTVITRQPSRVSAAVVRRSRATLSLNFVIQNARLLFGV